MPFFGIAVGDAELVRTIIADEEHFSKSGPGSAGVFYDQVMGRRALMNMDGAAHQELRRRIGDLFAPSYLTVVAREVLEPTIARLEAELSTGATVDLVPFAHLLTGRMICHQLGFTPAVEHEEETYLKLYDTGERLVGSLRLSRRALSGSEIARARRTYDELMAIARTSASKNVLETSIVARLRSAGLDETEVEGVLGSLFLVGTQSVSTALPRIVALLLDTGEMARLRAAPELIDRAIDEGLRYVVPSPVTLRRVAKTITLDGHRFREGDRVVVLTYNAAKDPQVFPSPFVFDIGRHHPAAGRHLWFGAGQHFCLGFGLAHMEIRWVLESLLRAGEVEVVSRRAARGVLLPAYGTFRIRKRTG